MTAERTGSVDLDYDAERLDWAPDPPGAPGLHLDRDHAGRAQRRHSRRRGDRNGGTEHGINVRTRVAREQSPDLLCAWGPMSYERRQVGTARLKILESDRTDDRLSTMAREVRAGLGTAPRSLPPKYFYDEVGSRLFDAICDLPEYYLTRAERGLLERHATHIVERSGAETLVEIGSGMARKTGLLVQAMCARGGSPRYVPFDIAPSAIAASARSILPEHPSLTIHGVVGDFAYDLHRVAIAAPPTSGPRLFAFLGSTIGNLDETQAPALVRDVSRLMTARDRFLLGVDLVKDERTLVAAYDDARGVTAAFNRNVLAVLSREMNGDFDIEAFRHLARWNAPAERIEMHLVSSRHQRVHLRSAGLRFELAAEETILTEISRKFTRTSVERTLFQGAMHLVDWWTDGDFALVLAARA
jgi:L-histidine N-alpha-methyltransferase